MPRVRAVRFVSLAAAGLVLMGGCGWTIGALRAIARAESERDAWQRPADVMSALAAGPGAVVADLGSGVGYFSLKLAPRVSPDGVVFALDRRRMPLAFVWLRALLGGWRRNVVVVHGDAAAPLPRGGLRGVLIANTYHELRDPPSVLARARAGLAPGGRIVVVDPAPGAEPPQASGHHHESAAAVALELRRAGFEIVSRDDHFVEPAGEHEGWWLLVGRKPQVEP